jgi:hypothetical protein
MLIGGYMKTGLDLIAAERERQIKEEKWTPEHDASHTDGALALAAACYASPELLFIQKHRANQVIFADPWPWPGDQDKRPYSGNMVLPNRAAGNNERIRQLSKAGALIAAELDRLLAAKGDK